MEKIKLKFVDFWYGFHREGNYFYQLLSQHFDVEFSETPDLIIYSCYGREYLKYNCTRIFYSAENMRPDFTGCDYAITFDYKDDPRHYRLPLYAIYIDQIDSINRLTRMMTRAEARATWRSKTKFCCMVVSNGLSRKRLDFFEKLSKHRQVDSGGKVLNNIGGPVRDKMQFIKDYRFVISFENASYPGYTTEKLIEPLMADCIPIYWGDPLVNKEFNSQCFLQLDGNKTEDELIEEILAIDADEDRAISMLSAAKFAGNEIPEAIQKHNLASFFKKIVIERKSKIPTSRTFKGVCHRYLMEGIYYFKRIKGIITRVIKKV